MLRGLFAANEALLQVTADSKSYEEYSTSDQILQSSSEEKKVMFLLSVATASPVRHDSHQEAHTGSDALLYRVRSGRKGRGRG